MANKLALVLQGRQLTVDDYDWTIRKYSVLPRKLFFLLLGFARQELTRLVDKDLHSVCSALKRAVRKAGKACGCDIKTKHSGADVVWCLNTELLAAFQFHKRKLNKERVVKLSHSGALLRLVLTYNEKGIFRVDPWKTRRD